jgi:uncharacterized protein YbaA (DUF1428 family)
MSTLRARAAELEQDVETQAKRFGQEKCRLEAALLASSQETVSLRAELVVRQRDVRDADSMIAALQADPRFSEIYASDFQMTVPDDAASRYRRVWFRSSPLRMESSTGNADREVGGGLQTETGPG